MMSIQIHSFFQEAWSPEDNAKLSFAVLEKNLLLVKKVLTPSVLMKIQPFRRNSKILPINLLWVPSIVQS